MLISSTCSRTSRPLFLQMKNCELNVRTLDEGALDEKSGMNFSEYIAILSGDTTLLEKAKVEKKVSAVLEGWKSAHYKEVARNRYSPEAAVKRLGEIKAQNFGKPAVMTISFSTIRS